MTSPQLATFELESYEPFDHIKGLIADAFMVSRTIPFPVPRTVVLPDAAPAGPLISDGCLALTEGMALYGS